MEKKTEVNRKAMWMTILLILFVKNLIKFFTEGGDKNNIALILLNLILIVAIFFGILNKEKIIDINKELFKQTKLDKYFKFNKNND